MTEYLQAEERAACEDHPAAETVPFGLCDKLRLPLSSIAGRAGFHAVFSRALTLAKQDRPRLQPLSIGVQGELEGFERVEPRLTHLEVSEGEVILVSHMLELLRTFVGEALMLRLLADLWPDASFDDIPDRKEAV